MGPVHRPRVKLSDFGLAKSLVSSTVFSNLTRQGEVGGSIGFLSPEHIRKFGEVREAADIYCAGATLFYLLTEKYPYLGFDPATRFLRDDSRTSPDPVASVSARCTGGPRAGVAQGFEENSGIALEVGRSDVASPPQMPQGRAVLTAAHPAC